MEENLLFRMSFILQDSSATSLDANLVKIIEDILYVENEPVSIKEIYSRIIQDCQLEFSLDEIQHAIQKKGHNIATVGEKYFLKPAYQTTIQKRGSVEDDLYNHVNDSIKELELDTEVEYLYGLIKQHLYNCFNENKDALLSLIRNESLGETQKVNYSNEDINLINLFLQWENPEKNRCVYKIISYCYVYCTLTVKKSNLLGTKLFRGKSFVLDANIIFRLAGINNDSRKFTISSFAKKCKEVGIELCYTEETLDEIHRVIKNKVIWIERITAYSEPIDLEEYGQNDNDFYKLYSAWCHDYGNCFDDYLGFQKYLYSMVYEVISQLKSVKSENYEIKNADKYKMYYDSLEKYKSVHTYKRQSKASISTDVNNLLYIMRLREENSVNDLWSAKVFLISADQNLVAWSGEVDKGVPLVVLPSVWLTIMLRFSGRQTVDDYKAFCSFLELRKHSTQNEIDVYSLLERLNTKVSSSELKKKIIKEVYENKEEYVLDEIDYDQTVEKAFDKVVSEIQEDGDQKYSIIEMELTEAKKQLSHAKGSLAFQKQADDEIRAQGLAIEDTRRHFLFATIVKKIKYPVAFLLLIVIIVVCIQTFRNKWFLITIIHSIFGEQLCLSNLLEIIGLICLGISSLAVLVNLGVDSLVSDEKQEKYRKKRVDFYLAKFGTMMNNGD